MLGLWCSALTVITWVRKPGQDAAAAVTKLKNDMDQRIGDLSKEFAVLQEHVEHLPTSEELGKLSSQVSCINGTLDGIKGAQTGLAQALARIENFLLTNK